MNTISKAKLAAIISVLVLFLVVVGFALSPVSPFVRSPNLELILTPADSTATIGGKTLRNGTNYVEPGTYTLLVEHAGFEPNEQELIVTEDLQTHYFSLKPESQEAQEWAEENQDQYLEAEADAGELANEEGEAFRDANPIVDELPYRSVLYNIDYRLSEADANTVVIIIGADTKEDREFAEEKIRSWGYDPKDYTIEQEPFIFK